MVEGQIPTAQTSEDPQSHPPQPEMAKGEPQVDLGEEEMDVESLRIIMGVMQDELDAQRANQETMPETIVLQKEDTKKLKRELRE